MAVKSTPSTLRLAKQSCIQCPRCPQRWQRPGVSPAPGFRPAGVHVACRDGSIADRACCFSACVTFVACAAVVAGLKESSSCKRFTLFIAPDSAASVATAPATAASVAVAPDSAASVAIAAGLSGVLQRGLHYLICMDLLGLRIHERMNTAGIPQFSFAGHY